MINAGSTKLPQIACYWHSDCQFNSSALGLKPDIFLSQDATCILNKLSQPVRNMQLES